MIHILMATYNGSDYLQMQLNSIAAQTEPTWKLHVCDDGSEDDTIILLKEFQKRYPDKVQICQNQTNQGAKRTFARLVREVREPGDYAFCDQDDIWREDKLEMLQQSLRMAESDGVPAAVYSDASIINEMGVVLDQSFVNSSGLYLSDKNMFEGLLLCNKVQGTAMLWNQELHRLVTDIPDQALMHDWWIAMAAAGHGKLVFLPEPLLQYRQHSDNVIGSFDRQKWHRSFREKGRMGNWRVLIENNHMLQKQRVEQAQAYVDRYGDERAKKYLRIMKKNRFSRAVAGIRGGYIFLSWKYSLKYYLL